MWPLKCAGKFGLVTVNIQSVPICYNVIFKEKKLFASQNFQAIFCGMDFHL